VTGNLAQAIADRFALDSYSYSAPLRATDPVSVLGMLTSELKVFNKKSTSAADKEAEIRRLRQTITRLQESLEGRTYYR
jgi:hypothetical protein